MRIMDECWFTDEMVNGKLFTAVKMINERNERNEIIESQWMCGGWNMKPNAEWTGLNSSEKYSIDEFQIKAVIIINRRFSIQNAQNEISDNKI